MAGLFETVRPPKVTGDWRFETVDGFREIVQRLDARMARIEEHFEAASEQARNMQTDLTRMHKQMDGALTEMRGMRADVMSFAGAVQGFGKAYETS